MRSPADPSSNLLRLPLTDLLQNLLHHDSSYVNYGASFVQFTYYVAVFGMLLAFLLSVRLSFNGWTSAEGLAALAFTMTGLLLQPAGLWVQPYHFGRVLAPLLVLLGLEYFRRGDWRRVLPICMVTPAILLVSAASALRIAKHLLETGSQIAVKHRGGHADRQGGRLDPLDFHCRRPHHGRGKTAESRQHDRVCNVLEQNGHGIDNQAVMEAQRDRPHLFQARVAAGFLVYRIGPFQRHPNAATKNRNAGMPISLETCV